MQINETRQDGAVVVAPVGRIDSTTSDVLDAHLVALSSTGEHRLVIDLSDVDYISSAGLRVMLSVAKRTKEVHGKLALTGLGASVRQVFEWAGFLPLFTIEATPEAAVAKVAD